MSLLDILQGLLLDVAGAHYAKASSRLTAVLIKVTIKVNVIMRL